MCMFMYECAYKSLRQGFAQGLLLIGQTTRTQLQSLLPHCFEENLRTKEDFPSAPTETREESVYPLQPTYGVIKPNKNSPQQTKSTGHH